MRLLSRGSGKLWRSEPERGIGQVWGGEEEEGHRAMSSTALTHETIYEPVIFAAGSETTRVG
jgi:hypothetical protein